MNLTDEQKALIAMAAGIPMRRTEKISEDGKTIHVTLTTEMPCDVQLRDGRFTVFTNPNLRQNNS